MTEDNSLSDSELDAVFSLASDNTPEPSAALLKSIMADADQVASAREQASVKLTEPPGVGLYTSLLNAVGGWPAMGGLATATVAGIWIGYASPATVDGLTDGYLASQTYQDMGDFLPTIDVLFEEG